MFARAYYALRFFTSRFFPQSGGATPAPDAGGLVCGAFSAAPVVTGVFSAAPAVAGTFAAEEC